MPGQFRIFTTTKMELNMQTLKFFLAGLLLICLTPPSVAANEAPAVGGQLPDIRLAVPAEPAHRQYLGLQGGASFTIPEIEADIVIVEIFSMYCPHCQREAPAVNEIYTRINTDPQLQGRVKMIGIGVGNSALEVDYFRKAYDIAFPLIADGDFTIHKLLGEVRTPFFIGVRNQANGGHEIFYAQLGGPQDAAAMLEALLNQSGLSGQ